MNKSTLKKFLLLLIPVILLSGTVCAEVRKPENKENKTKLLYIKKKFFEEFPYIIPGTTTEEGFLNENPELAPYDEDGNPDTNSVYVLKDELKESGYYYDRAVLNFENGILQWVNLIPKNLTFAKYSEHIKTPYKVEPVDKNYDLYDFTSHILVVDKKTDIIQSIGVFREGVNF